MSEYEVICHENLQTVVEAVMNLMKNGWVPQGGISSQGRGVNAVFVQALVREDQFIKDEDQ